MFLLQLFVAFQDIVFFSDHPGFVILELGIDIKFPWAHFRHSSEWLAGVNATRKWTGGADWLDFWPGCEIAEGYWNDVEEIPVCNAWYLLLIGELRLRDDPVITVKTLELCLFALSGSVFLLITR